MANKDIKDKEMKKKNENREKLVDNLHEEVTGLRRVQKELKEYVFKLEGQSLCHTMACFERDLHTLISGGDHVVLALYRSY